MGLSSEQQSFVDEVLSGRHQIHLLNGGAGTGKSFVVRELKTRLENVIIGCPTAKAASIVGGRTNHLLFGLPEGVYNPEIGINRQRASKPQTRYFTKSGGPILRAAQHIVLDEISMVRCDHLDAISDALKAIRKTDKPFGGKTVIMVGDMGQLLPVVDREESEKLLDIEYEIPFGVQQSRVWKEIGE